MTCTGSSSTFATVTCYLRFFSEQEMISKGYPSYTTSAGWLGYTDSQLRELCQKYLKAGWTRFVQVHHAYKGLVLR